MVRENDLKRYFVRQRAYFDGYLHEIVDGWTNTVINTYNYYDLAHKHCSELNNAQKETINQSGSTS